MDLLNRELPASQEKWRREHPRLAAWVNEYQLRHELGLTTDDITSMEPEKLMFFSIFMSEMAQKQQRELEKAKKEARAPRRH